MIFYFSHTLGAVELQNHEVSIAELSGGGEYFIENRPINRSEFHKLCKIKNVVTTEGASFVLDFEQDRFSKTIYIQNTGTRTVNYLSIFFKPFGSSNSVVTRVKKHIFRGMNATVKPNTMNGMSKFAEIIKIVGHVDSETKVTCSLKYTELEIAEKQKKLDAERKKRDELAEKERKKEIIYDNCVIDKIDSQQSQRVQNSVFRTCKRISENPSWWHKFWYLD